MKRSIAISAGSALAALGIVLGAAAPANAGIRIYDGINYSSLLGDYGTGTTYVGSSADNRASSLSVSAPANYAIPYDGRNYTGASPGTFYIGAPNLADWGFNNRTTSIG